MPRSGEDARRRLSEAALALFQERGYDSTTAAEIAARAGVTERTFFRHFKDKREVLFGREEDFRDALVRGVQGAPAGLDSMDTLLAAFAAMGPLLEANRPLSGPRLAVIAKTPALRERMAAKTSALVDALSGALQARGAPESTAGLAAQVGMALFSHALEGWAREPGSTLETHLARAAEALRGL